VFITNVSLLDYKSNRAELLLSASDVFEFLMSESADKIQHTEYLMNDVSIAHADLESKKIIGPAIFVI
ncbi:MAG: quinone oxidoreductase, partial [Proteobacteria bacterium]|nr:quinone oxidoreductase [Pseudomonadota bacterium]